MPGFGLNPALFLDLDFELIRDLLAQHLQPRRFLLLPDAFRRPQGRVHALLKLRIALLCRGCEPAQFRLPLRQDSFELRNLFAQRGVRRRFRLSRLAGQFDRRRFAALTIACTGHQNFKQRDGGRADFVLGDQPQRQGMFIVETGRRKIAKPFQLILRQRPGAIAVILSGGQPRRLRQLLDPQRKPAAVAVWQDQRPEIQRDRGAFQRCARGRIGRGRCRPFRHVSQAACSWRHCARSDRRGPIPRPRYNALAFL